MSRKGTGRGPDLVCGEVGEGSLMSASQLRSESWTPTQLGAWGAREAPAHLCPDPADSTSARHQVRIPAKAWLHRTEEMKQFGVPAR